MYHVWNNVAGKFEVVTITNPFQLTGYIVVFCSEKDVYLCLSNDYTDCAKKLVEYLG